MYSILVYVKAAANLSTVKCCKPKTMWLAIYFSVSITYVGTRWYVCDKWQRVYNIIIYDWAWYFETEKNSMLTLFMLYLKHIIDLI